MIVNQVDELAENRGIKKAQDAVVWIIGKRGVMPIMGLKTRE